MRARWISWFGAVTVVVTAIGCGRTGLDGTSVGAGRGGLGNAGNGAGAGFGGAGGAAGRSGVSGMAGMAGMESCGPLIDDLESGTGRICHGEGRVGVWYAFNDESGSQWPALTPPGTPIPPSPIPGRRGASTIAMHTYGEGFGLWGAGVGLDLSFDGMTYGLYDARARGYDGVTFWARGTPAARVSFRISTAQTTLTTYGGVCTREPCNPFPVPLYFGEEWTQYWVPFVGVPGTIPLESDKLTNMQFLTDPNGPPFDFWIDDISFYSGPPACCPSDRGCEGTVGFADPALEAAVRAALGKADELLTCDDVCFLHDLAVIPTGVTTLDGLECLAGLTTLSVAQNSIAEITPLGPLTSLTSLNLSQNLIADLAPLADLTNLVNLSLQSNELVDATPLSAMHALVSLDLSDNRLTDVSALSGIRTLTSLNLSSNRLLDVPAFPGANLKIVVLASNQLADVQALSGLEQLTDLTLRDNRIEGIRAPFAAPKLTALDATTNRLTDIGGLAGAPLLASLYLSQNQITNVSSLAGLTHLAVIDLSQNPLADLAPLTGLDVGTLNLAQTAVSDLTALHGMMNLRFLDVSDAPVLDLGPLSGSTFDDLRLARTRVRDLSPLASVTFQNVTFERGGRSGVLDLTGSQVEDLGPLVANPAIPAAFNVVVAANPIDCQSQAANITALRRRGVNVGVDCP